MVLSEATRGLNLYTLKILLVMDPGISVPPIQYGGHERLVSMFIEEYSRLGHEVSLLAGPDSIAPKTYFFGKNDLERSKVHKYRELAQAWTFLYRKAKNFDLIHNFGRLLYLLPILNNPVKKIMTYGRDVTGSAIQQITSLPNKNLIFTACSDYCVSTGNTSGIWRTVYNAIDFSKYTFRNSVPDDAPLMFLGRIEEIKGTHTAIQVAKTTGNKLWIAGNVAKEHIEFFKTQIEPYVDNHQIFYLGPLNDLQKNEYLGRAKVLLFPIEWSEPFGMVMVEAMACGTPVIAINRGSVSEVINEGITGFKVNNKEEMINRLDKLSDINRMECRRLAQSRFDVSVIAQNYLSLFND